MTSTLEAWGVVSVLELAELLVSEVATNAILHAKSDVEIVLEVRGGVLRVEVADHGHASPSRRHYGLEAATGRGMMLVEELTRGWGIDERTDGKVVWFELDLESADEGCIQA